jgi:type IV pilus assembly protein PilV
MPDRRAAADHRTAGFTLLEVLATLVLLSVGMLGIAMLYLESLRINQLALQRTQAVTLAADLADRIRANRVPADTYACGDPCLPGSGGNAVAATDLARWLDDVAGQLPDGTGAVRFTAATIGAPARYVVTVRWTAVGHVQPHSLELRLEI